MVTRVKVKEDWSGRHPGIATEIGILGSKALCPGVLWEGEWP
jgi:hypothetical protein